LRRSGQGGVPRACETLYQAVSQQILGDDKFIEEVEKKIERLQRSLRKPSLEEILVAVKKVTGITENEIWSRGRRKEVKFARGYWFRFGENLDIGWWICSLFSEEICRCCRDCQKSQTMPMDEKQ